MKLLEILNWRYATKKYSSKKVSGEKISEIIEAINLSATSTGIQPFRLIVISDPELQNELRGNSFNTQIAEASHLIIFAAFTSITKEMIDSYLQLVATERGMAIESLQPFRDSLCNNLLSRNDEENAIWAAKQAYIGLGTGLIAAANLQTDATPMEGFDAAKFDEILQLKARGLKSVVVMALGYRDAANDFLAKLKKVRLPVEEFVTKISLSA